MVPHMAKPALSPEKKPDSTPSPKKKAKPGFVSEAIEKVRSHDVVFAVTGYLGSGMTDVSKKLEALLQREPGTVSLVKVSNLLTEEANKRNQPIPENTKLQRTRALQQFGDALRTDHGTDVVAGLVIREIAGQCKAQGKTAGRRIFVIDCLKHPDEVKALQLVYGPSFFLVSSICDYETRLSRLRKKFDGESDPSIAKIMDDDAEEEAGSGQKVRKTIPLADYFVNQHRPGDQTSTPTVDEQLRRLLDLVLGTEVQRPNHDERGMYAAWGAAMRSACLSRQVGAAILNPQGIVIATGTNDVPAPGGGIYGNESEPDSRCFLSMHKEPGRSIAERQRRNIQLRILGKDEDPSKGEARPFCRSDFTKDAIWQVVSTKLNEALSQQKNDGAAGASGASTADAGKRFTKEDVQRILDSTPIKDLVEFSRAIHAEADAIVSLARAGGPSCHRASLYVNVYPCHLCTRQIIAAGIAEVVYIEPYPKSLATILHDDAIFDPEAKSSPAKDEKRIKFRLFSGVAPRRYVDLFEKHENLKQVGTLSKDRKRPLDPLFQQSHIELQATIAKEVTSVLEKQPDDAGKEET